MSVVLKNVVKIYGSGPTAVTALKNLNLSVEKGEIRAIVGPSGSGKTTLINIIGGIDKPNAGQVIVDNEDITTYDEKRLLEYRRKKVGIVFQFFNLIPTLTAAENIELPMIILGIPKEERKRRVEELLRMVGMEHRKDHKPGELSGGEQQRVAIAAALANDPVILLADEPTGELDTKNSRLVAMLFRDLNKETGKTIIIVTHDIAIATYATRISRIEDGVITETFTPAEMEAIFGAVRVDEKYVHQLEERISKIEEEIKSLEKRFKEGQITADEFVKRYNELKETKEKLENELKRHTLI